MQSWLTSLSHRSRNDAIMETATSVTAGAFVVNPWWLDAIHTYSPVGSVVLQVLGASWIVMQMYYKWKKGQ